MYIHVPIDHSVFTCYICYIYLVSLYPGDLASMRAAETKVLDELENATVKEAGPPTHGCPEVDEEEKEPAKKKRRVEKENVGASNVSGRGKKRKETSKSCAGMFL